MSHHPYPQYPYQSSNVYGSPPQRPNEDERRPSHSRSPPSVQVVEGSRPSRSVSSTRMTAPNQAQPIDIIDPYGKGQNWESGPRHVPSTPAQPYVGSYGEHGGSSIQAQSHPRSVEQQFQPPNYPPPHPSQHHRTSYSRPQQPSVPYNEPYHVHSQNAQYPQSPSESGAQSWPMQQPSSQYPQQQTWGSATAYSPPQQPSSPQYLRPMQPISNQPHPHQMQPISNHPRQSQPPSQYPGGGTWSNVAGESPPIDDLVFDFQADSSPSLPVGGLVCCPRCGTTYQARGRSGSRYDVGQHDTEPGNLVGYGLLPPCPTCGQHPAR